MRLFGFEARFDYNISKRIWILFRVNFVRFGLLFPNMLRNFRFISSAHVLLTFPSTDDFQLFLLPIPETRLTSPQSLNFLSFVTL